MGQSYVGAAVLHHLEGFHVQTLDLATLVADSSRTMEAACVQLFVEAKRHKPSILFIPSLTTWCTSVTDTVKSTIKGLLDGLDPSDPILLLAVVDGALSELPGDVRSWFGFVKGNRVHLGKPSSVSLLPSLELPSQRDSNFRRSDAGSTQSLFCRRSRRNSTAAERVPRRNASSQARPRGPPNRTSSSAASTYGRRDPAAGAERPAIARVPQVEDWAHLERAQEAIQAVHKVSLRELRALSC
jgi:SpoVK/Ycf46/Vps4 family AAA+-type ATPase